MRLWGRYVTLIIAAPLLVLLPFALAFLAQVLRPTAGEGSLLALVAVVLYAGGATVAALLLGRYIREAEGALEMGGDASAAISAALLRSEIVAASLWIGWGLFLAAVGTALLHPTLTGLQYFGEAALIIAAPAMAWTYWAGKGILLNAAGRTRTLRYHGMSFSVGAKLGMVFIGFFVVSTGALVLLVSSHVETRMRSGLSPETIAADVTRYGLIIGGITAAIFAVATWFLARDIVGPIKELIHLAQEMAEGRFDTSPHIFSDDEVGRLVESFGATRSNLRTLISRLSNSGTAISGGVRLMNSGTATLLSSAHEQRDLTSSAATAVASVRNEAESVLEAIEKVSEVTLDSASRATELSASSAEVARRMDELFRSVEKTSSATLQVEATAREMTSRTNLLAEASEDVLTFVAEMDATIEEINRTTEASAALSLKVRDHAQSGREAVDSTVEGIRRTQESTRRTAGSFDALQKSLGQIDQILEFIDELTNRTNLLSLNASIIAAQAGENDYGFSVIADEVRQLADRTRSATKEIAEIIRSVQPITREAFQATEEGVAVVDRTVQLAQGAAAALQRILESASSTGEMVETISISMKEQRAASRHLHDVTARVSDTVSEIHRGTQGQADATRLLAAESERVSDIALHVKRATEEQRQSGEGIAQAMDQIAADVSVVRDRMQRQLEQAEQIAHASRVTLDIAEKNNVLAEEFDRELGDLLRSGKAFEEEMVRFRV